jgi:hypothetical protein
MTQVVCPECGAAMFPVFVIMSGGVWLSESRARMERLVKWRQEEEMQPSKSPQSLEPKVYCVVGGAGHAVGEWPKQGLFCYECSSFFVSIHGNRISREAHSP